jgi:predicted TIM-barrel fold metal-dependent hydrolase
VQYINTLGRDKVMFGTDWPIYGPERGIGEIEELNLRPEARQKLYRDNAVKLFKLDDREARQKPDKEAWA